MNRRSTPLLAAVAAAAALAMAGPLSGADAATEPQTPVATLPAPGSQPQPIAGAFGLNLGARFEPAMVARILSRREHSYRDRNKVEVKGSLYAVEPRVPSDEFSEYLVATTPDGVIYSISGVYADPENKSRCDVTRRLAAQLEDKYGKPRGKGSFGNWYAFRDLSTETYRGVRLYAPKCRSGRYSIVYSDDAAKWGLSRQP